MKPVLFIVAAIMAVIGIVWIFQGIGVIKGSFMTDQIMWTYIGIVVVLVAGGLVWWNLRRPSNRV